MAAVHAAAYVPCQKPARSAFGPPVFVEKGGATILRPLGARCVSDWHAATRLPGFYALSPRASEPNVLLGNGRSR